MTTRWMGVSGRSGPKFLVVLRLSEKTSAIYIGRRRPALHSVWSFPHPGRPLPFEHVFAIGDAFGKGLFLGTGCARHSTVQCRVVVSWRRSRMRRLGADHPDIRIVCLQFPLRPERCGRVGPKDR